MTISEYRKSKDYAESMERIRNYRPGFKLHLDYTKIPRPAANALRILCSDACDLGLLRSVEFSLSLDLEVTEETFERLYSEVN